MKMRFFQIFLLFCLFAKAVTTSAQITPVGSLKFTASRAYWPCMTVSKSGTPYITFQDSAHGSKLSVMKYNGSWAIVGSTTISETIPYNFSPIAIDKSNIPYVICNETSTYSLRGRVLKFNGASWVDVDSNSLPNPGGLGSITIDSADVPYALVEDTVGVSVKKYNGTSWVYVGTQYVTRNQVAAIQLIFGKYNVPYVFYENASPFRYEIKKLVDTGWLLITTHELFPTVNTPAYTIDTNDNLYIAYADTNASFKLTVDKYNGTSWSVVGSRGVSTGQYGVSFDLDMKTDKYNNVYVAYNDDALGGKAVLQKWNGTVWSTLGYPFGFSVGSVSTVSLSIDTTANVYIGFRDLSGGNDKLSVYKCVTGTGINKVEKQSNVLAAYPNPCNGSFTLSDQTNCSYAIVNETGQIIKTGELNSNNARTVQIKGLAMGIYFIRSGNESLKLIAQ